MSHALVCRLDSMGDVILAGPAVRAVAEGTDRVTMLCSPVGSAAAALLPGVDGVEVFDAPWIAADPTPVGGPVRRLPDRIRELDVDEAVILTSFHQSALPLALLLRLAGVRRIGAISEDYPGSLLDVRHHVPDDIHEVERGLSLAAALGHRLAPHDDGHLAVRGHTGDPVGGRPVRAFARRPRVVIHPGASVTARAWHPERLRLTADELASRGYEVAVTGSTWELRLTDFVASDPRVEDLGGLTSLAALADELRRADVVVVGNTGPMHLAAAVGTPVVCLFAPTVPPVRWRPWGVRHHLLGDLAISCAGCRAAQCPKAGHPCLGSVAVADVVDAVEDLLLDTRELCG